MMCRSCRRCSTLGVAAHSETLRDNSPLGPECSNFFVSEVMALDGLFELVIFLSEIRDVNSWRTYYPVLVR